MVLSVSAYRCIAALCLLGLIGFAMPAQADPQVNEPLGVSDPTLAVNLVLANAVTEADIWSHLQQPDTHYFVLMRHALAPGTGDPAHFQLDDCATQRNLSEQGRDQAAIAGSRASSGGMVVMQLDQNQPEVVGQIEPF